MSAGVIGLKATVKRAWPVLLAYGLFSIWGVACLTVSLVAGGGFGLSPNSIATLGGIIAAAAVGHLFGNFLGLVRLRLAVVVVLFTGLFILSTISGAVVGPLAIFAIIAVFASVGGYLGIASRLDVVASWFPLSFAIGGAITWMNRHQAVATFNSGSKHQVWDLFTLACLGGAVFLMLVFLATRNSLGLTVWQEVARPTNGNGEGVAVARPGRGSMLVLMVFTVVVLGMTALVSPYLFRTRDAKDGDQSSQGGDKGDKGNDKGDGDKGDKGAQQGQGKDGQGNDGQGDDGQGKDGQGKQGQGKQGQGKQGQGKQGQGKQGQGKQGQGQQGQGKQGDGAQGQGQGQGGQGDKGDPLDAPPDSHASEAASEAMSLGAKIFGWLLVVALILLFLLLAVAPPFRRMFLLRHLERPLWPVSPTSRVMNLWRRAIASLAMVDIEPAAGESPRDFARRARTELATHFAWDAAGLEESAAIVEKIDYAGRGLGPTDEQTMRERISAFVQQLDGRIGAGKKMKSAWGRAPEVES